MMPRLKKYIKTQCWAPGERCFGCDHYHGKADRCEYYGQYYCDECGTELIDHCFVCGAPQCCPVCCKITSLEGVLHTIVEQAPRNGEDVSYLLAKQGLERYGTNDYSDL